jgi:purine-binding chemotaxis protein CheW
VSDAAESLVIFRSGAIRFGVDLDSVQRVVAACEVSPLPDAPTAVSGVVTIDGDVIAVVDPHRLFSKDRSTQPGLDSRFLLVTSPSGTIAIVADMVEGAREVLRTALKAAEQLVSGMSLLREVAVAVGGLIYIFDPKSLLTEADAVTLRAAISRLKS